MSIYPRLNDAPTSNETDEYLRFQGELNRMKQLVDAAPQYNPNRQIDRAAQNMPADKKDEFLRAGNQLLVSSNTLV